MYKNLNEKDFEIMAPVGSYESLMAAIQGGADSIYFGIEGLNMRSRSSNNFYDGTTWRKIVAICREHGIKSYLTVNTVIYGEDLPFDARDYRRGEGGGSLAIIAADVAAMNYANSIGQEVHLSTQLNISNAEALKFYARFADVVVLARRAEPETSARNLPADRRPADHRAERRTDPHRNVCPWSPLYGRFR